MMETLTTVIHLLRLTVRTQAPSICGALGTVSWTCCACIQLQAQQRACATSSCSCCRCQPLHTPCLQALTMMCDIWQQSTNAPWGPSAGRSKERGVCAGHTREAAWFSVLETGPLGGAAVWSICLHKSIIHSYKVKRGHVLNSLKIKEWNNKVTQKDHHRVTSLLLLTY